VHLGERLLETNMIDIVVTGSSVDFARLFDFFVLGGRRKLERRLLRQSVSFVT